MTTQYGSYTPMAPRTMSQNRNSAISSPRTRQPAGTNTGLANQNVSAVRNSLNVPTQTAPGGHRQVPFGGRTTATQMSNDGNPISPSPDPNAFQDQLTRQNNLMNRGGLGMPIPRGNPQSAPPQGIYNRPQYGRRY